MRAAEIRHIRNEPRYEIRLSAKGAANLISYRGVRRITAKVKTVICEQAPNHGSYFAYARLIARVNSQFTKHLKTVLTFSRHMVI